MNYAKHTLFPSRFAIGDRIKLHPSIGHALGVVVEVGFKEGKVIYGLDLDVGGETLRNVDSTFVDVEAE